MNSPHSASGYYTIYGEESLQADHFNTRLSFGETHTLWARTGYLGFVRRTELLDASGGLSILPFFFFCHQRVLFCYTTFCLSWLAFCEAAMEPHSGGKAVMCEVIWMSSLDRHDALFVVGSLDETLELRGLRYHPIDIETLVSRGHRSIAER